MSFANPSISFSIGKKEYTREGRTEEFLHIRDVNDVESEEIVYWACATREILARAAEGLYLATGEPLPASIS